MWYNIGYMPKGIYKRSEETIQKLVNRNKLGLQKWSEESKKKVGDRVRGKPSGMLGKRHTEDAKMRIRKNVIKAQTPEVRLKKSLSHRGEKNYNWKGDRTSLKHQIRTGFLYRQWRSDIFTRDGFACVWCGDNKGGNLEADHIVTLREILDTYNITTLEESDHCQKLWDLNNGRTLCEKCHKSRHIKS